MRNGVGWVCSFYSFYQAPWGKPATLSHTLLSPTSLHSHTRTPLPPHTVSPPLAIVICACFLQGLTMNQMKKLLERKVSLLRYLPAYP